MAKRLIAAIANLAANRHVLDVSLAREKIHANKHEEAVALVERYPEPRSWLPPKRRLWETEHRNMVLFEALALARAVLRGPTTTLAASLG